MSLYVENGLTHRCLGPLVVLESDGAMTVSLFTAHHMKAHRACFVWILAKVDVRLSECLPQRSSCFSDRCAVSNLQQLHTRSAPAPAAADALREAAGLRGRPFGPVRHTLTWSSPTQLDETRPLFDTTARVW